MAHFSKESQYLYGGVRNQNFSKHIFMAKSINKILINKVYVIGNEIKETFKRIQKTKRGAILKNDSELNHFIIKKLKDNDYLMVKGSNSTGLFNFVSKLKKVGTDAL